MIEDRPIDDTHPYPGLREFHERDQSYFFGRQREARELLRHVKRQALTILFGRSGLGKSSLLLAGLFPMLRAERHFPIAIRLTYGDADVSLLDQVRSRIAEEIRTRGIDVAPPGGEQTLWEYFHRNTFWNQKNWPLTPVLVFDQFEEFFTLGSSAEQANPFIDGLADVVENWIPASLRARMGRHADALPESYATLRTRVILALREDHLADLESLGERMPSISRNRYRLTQLSGECALEAIRNPAPERVSDRVARLIVRFVGATAAPSGAGQPLAGDELDVAHIQVEPPLLSLVCEQLNARRIEKSLDVISEDLLQIARDDVLPQFYENCLGSLALDVRAPVRRFVEEKLLTEDGRRTPVAVSVARRDHGVDAGAIMQLVNRRLLRLEERFGTPHVELVHDVLCDVVRRGREKRRGDELDAARKRSRRQRIRKQLAGAFSLLVVVFLIALGVGYGKWGLEARDALAALHLEKGRQEFLAGDSFKAIADLSESCHINCNSEELRRLMSLAFRTTTTTVDRCSGLLQALRGEPISGSSDGEAAPMRPRAIGPGAERLLCMNPDGDLEIWSRSHSVAEPMLQIPANPEVSINSALFNASASFVIAFDKSGAHIWSTETAEVVAEFKGVYAVSIDDLATRAVTMSYDAGARVHALNGEATSWSLSEAIEQLPERCTSDGDPFPDIRSGTISPDAEVIATFGYGPRVLLWDAETGQCLRALDIGGRAVSYVVFDSSGEHLAAAGEHGSLDIWPVTAGGETLGLIDAQSKKINFVAFSGDGARILTGSDDRSARVWNTRTGVLQATYEGHRGAVVAGSILPDERVVTLDEDRVATLWSGLRPLELDQPDAFRAMYSADAKRIVTIGAGAMARLWDSSSGTLIEDLKVNWDPLLRDPGPNSGSQANVHSVDFVGDPQRIIVTGNSLSVESGEGEEWQAQAWDLSGKPIERMRFFRDGENVQSVVVGPDLALVLIKDLDEESTVAVRKLSDGSDVATLRGHDESIASAAFMGSARIVTASADDTARVWDAMSGNELCVMRHQADVVSARPSRDGLRIVTASVDATAAVWSSACKNLVTLQGHGAALVSARFDLSGERVITTSVDATAMLWDALDGTPLATLDAHSQRVSDGRFSPDGTLVVTTSDDGTAGIWTVPAGDLMASLSRLPEKIRSAIFDPSTTRVVTTAGDSVQIWDIEADDRDPEEITAEACRLGALPRGSTQRCPGA